MIGKSENPAAPFSFVLVRKVRALLAKEGFDGAASIFRKKRP
jgi:hypothetical protein